MAMIWGLDVHYNDPTGYNCIYCDRKPILRFWIWDGHRNYPYDVCPQCWVETISPQIGQKLYTVNKEPTPQH